MAYIFKPIVTAGVLAIATAAAHAQSLPITGNADPTQTYLVIGTNPIVPSPAGPPTSCFGGGSFCVRPAGINVNYFATASDLNAAAIGLTQRIDTSMQLLQQADRGVAAVAAMANISMPSAPGRTTWALNGAVFQSEFGGGLSLAHRLNTSTPLAVTASYGNGGGTAHVGRIGLMGEF